MNLDVAAHSVDLPFPVLHSAASKQTKSRTVAQSLIVTGSYRTCVPNRHCKNRRDGVNTSSAYEFTLGVFYKHCK